MSAVCMNEFVAVVVEFVAAMNWEWEGGDCCWYGLLLRCSGLKATCPQGYAQAAPVVLPVIDGHTAGPCRCLCSCPCRRWSIPIRTRDRTCVFCLADDWWRQLLLDFGAQEDTQWAIPRILSMFLRWYFGSMHLGHANVLMFVFRWELSMSCHYSAVTNSPVEGPFACHLLSFWYHFQSKSSIDGAAADQTGMEVHCDEEAITNSSDRTKNTFFVANEVIMLESSIC